MTETFEFDHNGGYIATLTDDELIIECKGLKGFIFYRAKPRIQHIALDDILRIDTKEPGMKLGYGRFITEALLEHPSSSYVAMNDPNSIMIENDEEEEMLNILIKKLRKKRKNITVQVNKM